MQTLDRYTEILLHQQQAARDAHLEQRRRLHLALENRRVRFYQPALISLGRRMVIWGTQLQRTNREDRLHAREVVFAPYNK